ncbi:uncharacterized protein [Nicotiana tomentosiformis]|uniref:uncharacterized protein n=1 Tax=Nicotiana tomentosiformis TaxID=4098 RepID=UPI00388CD5E0
MAGVVSRKSMGSLAHLEAYQRLLAKEVHLVASLGVHLANSSEEGMIEEIHKHKTVAFSLGMDDGTRRYQGRLCVPNVDGFWERIMTEAHTSRYFVHAGSTKSAHFLPVKATDIEEHPAKLYIKEIVRLHGTPISIISD